MVVVTSQLGKASKGDDDTSWKREDEYQKTEQTKRKRDSTYCYCHLHYIGASESGREREEKEPERTKRKKKAMDKKDMCSEQEKKQESKSALFFLTLSCQQKNKER